MLWKYPDRTAATAGQGYHHRPWRVSGGISRGNRGVDMLRATARQNQAISWDNMTTRTAALVSIVVIATLAAVVAIAVITTHDLSERVAGIVVTVLTSFTTVLAGLLLFLRVETVNKETAAVSEKVDQVHHLVNGGLRHNVTRAISEHLESSESVTITRDALDELLRRAKNPEEES